MIDINDRLEAAEKDIALKESVIDSLGSALNAVANERDALLRDNTALRVKVEAMEKQEPTMWANSSNIISAKINKERRGAGDQHTCSETKTAYHDTPLYLAPGAPPAPSFADAYQGARECVVIWKKRALEAEDLNRKFVAEINGPAYMGEPAQPAPSVPEAKPCPTE